MVALIRVAVVKMVINGQLIRYIVEIEPRRLNYGLDSECEEKNVQGWSLGFLWNLGGKLYSIEISKEQE